jgi:hypothetical protein
VGAGVVVVVELSGRRRNGGVPAAARCGTGGGRAVVAAAAAGGALRAAGRARAAVPVPLRLRPGDGGAHGGGYRQAHVAGHLPQRSPPGPRLLPLLEKDLRYAAVSVFSSFSCFCRLATRSNGGVWRRADVPYMVRADAAADGGGAGAHPRDLPGARGGVRPLRGAPRGPAARGRRPRQPPRRQVGPPPPRPHPRLLPGKPQRTYE